MDGEEEILKGVVDAPADWEYTVRMGKEDWGRILEIATSPDVGRFLVKTVGLGVLFRMGFLIVKFVALLGVFGVTRVSGGKRNVQEELRPKKEAASK